MSKRIFYTNNNLEEMKKHFEKNLLEISEKIKHNTFLTDEEKTLNINLKLDDYTDDKKANLIISQNAWSKMLSLVVEFNTEIQWHALVTRKDQNSFYVKDVLVFPHSVSAATVTSDQKKYEDWLNSLDDETFFSLRFHGHSHVNMDVNPSSTDMTYRHTLIKNLGKPSQNEDLFYIFIILNKKGGFSGEIYDLTNNCLYSTSDINLQIEINENNTINDFIKNARELTKKEILNTVDKPSCVTMGNILDSWQPNKESHNKKCQSKKDFYTGIFNL